jgi:hypothetical protein
MPEVVSSTAMKGGWLAGLISAIVLFTIALAVVLVTDSSPNLSITAAIAIGAIIVGAVVGYVVGR